MSSPIFISYSHRDTEYLEMFQTFLKPFIRGKQITPWDDRQIKPGTLWREEIKNALARADVAVLLVSQYFLASDFIDKDELPPILEAARTRGLTVYWIAVKSSSFENTPLERYHALGNPREPLNSLTEAKREDEMVKMCAQIASELKPETAEFTFPLAESETIEDTSLSAQDGLKALTELMRNREIRDRVVEFKIVFGTSCKQIEILGFYKDLHDLLHTLQFKCYSYLMNIIRTVKMRPDDLSMWENVFEYEETLRDIVDGLKEAANQDNLMNAVPWVKTLIEDLQKLFQAVTNNDVEEITVAIRPIQRILSREPVRLNDRLNEAARALPLPALVDALNKVQSRLHTESAIARRFGKGVDALKILDCNLRNLRDMHDKWQNLDIEIRRIEGTLAQDLCELEFSWAYLKTLTEQITLGCEENWAKNITKAVGNLDEAISNNDLDNAKRHFLRYRSIAGNRFYQVDTSLKELCVKLREVGEPLTIVWEIIK